MHCSSQLMQALLVVQALPPPCRRCWSSQPYPTLQALLVGLVTLVAMPLFQNMPLPTIAAVLAVAAARMCAAWLAVG